VPGNGRKWDQRIARACDLAEAYPFAREILLFYSQLAAFQKNSYLQIPSTYGSGSAGPSSLPSALDDIDLRHLLTRWQPFLSLIEAEAPGTLSRFARGLKVGGADITRALLRAAWPTYQPTTPERGDDVGAPLVGVPSGATRGDAHTFERFCSRAFLQPFAEFLADHAEVPTPAVRLATCPYCGSPPLVGVLRPEGEGAKRSLICSFCRTEWDYLRIACPACDERREEKLCVYTSSKFEGVRVEACDTCKAYINTVDLTHSGLAVPEVDELAAIPLTLWADEKGYHKAARSVLCL
jgi:formate dehydrogenase maturation protein FdhE